MKPILLYVLKNTWAAIQNVFLNSREQQHFEDVKILSSSSFLKHCR